MTSQVFMHHSFFLMTSLRVLSQTIELLEVVDFTRPVPKNRYCCYSLGSDQIGLLTLWELRREQDSSNETFKARIAAV